MHYGPMGFLPVIKRKKKHNKNHKNFNCMGAGNGIWDKCNITEYLTIKEKYLLFLKGLGTDFHMESHGC